MRNSGQGRGGHRLGCGPRPRDEQCGGVVAHRAQLAVRVDVAVAGVLLQDDRAVLAPVVLGDGRDQAVHPVPGAQQDDQAHSEDRAERGAPGGAVAPAWIAADEGGGEAPHGELVGLHVIASCLHGCRS